MLQLLHDFHFAYGSHIQRLFFTESTPIAQTRARNRFLSRLIENRLLYRHPRRPLPGNQHGSSEHIYTLSHAGQRIINVLQIADRPYHSVEPTTTHFDHALAVTELYVQLQALVQSGSISHLIAKGEPATHRPYGLSKLVLKPDMEVLFRLTKDGQQYEVAWFIEVERSRQGEPATAGKVTAYLDYMQQLNPNTELMPRIVFLTFTESHRNHLAAMLIRLADRNENLFTTALFDKALTVMTTLE